ncbi:MAG: ribonuclease H-like domain-containing protein [Deltaproteobacteria bacterium]|nr:ribonuclease H-like domain-containing protein [Deltaproteobacteria bacterium]
MSRLADQIRRSLSLDARPEANSTAGEDAPTESSSEVVRRLRHELARIDQRYEGYPKKRRNTVPLERNTDATAHRYELLSKRPGLQSASVASPKQTVVEPTKAWAGDATPRQPVLFPGGKGAQGAHRQTVAEGGFVFRHTFTQRLTLDGALGQRAPDKNARLSPDDTQALRLAEFLALDPSIKGCPTNLEPTEIAFVDTETTGLSRGAGTIAFMIGVGRFVEVPGGLRLCVEQFVVHELAREVEVLEAVAKALEGARLMVTFNGRGFDVPILESRALINRSALTLPTAHLDLLPWARRLFRCRVSDCRLTTLERELLDVQRLDDMPGSEAPAAYTRYLNTGAYDALFGVLEHNLIDVATLAALLWRVADGVLDPLRWSEDGDELYAIAKIWSETNTPLAEACLERALVISGSPWTRRRVLVFGAGLRRRRGDAAGAKALWERYSEEFPQDDEGWIALAKHYEHVERDFGAALRMTQRARDHFDGTLTHRVTRLERRLATPH